MPYRKHLKTEQKLLLRPLNVKQKTERVEILTAYILHSHGDSCDLRLPYNNRPGEEFPFCKEMAVELSGESLGLGVRITGRFDRYLGNEMVRINLDPTLEVFQRRIHPRQDIRVGLRYTRGHGTLKTFRQQWEKNVHILASNNLKKLGSFPLCHINLSQGGLRFMIKPPVQIADICIILLELQPKTPPVCAMAEVVWTSDGGDDQNQDGVQVGMQFINIMKSDQRRIDEFMHQASPQNSTQAAASDR